MAGNLVLADIERSGESLALFKGTTFTGQSALYVGRVCAKDDYLQEGMLHWANLSPSQHQALSHHGKELFYLNGNKLMAVDVNGAGEAFQAGVPKELFEAPLVTEYRRRNRYDVTRDGKRFLVIAPADDKQEQQITVIVNWPALLKH